MAKQLTHHESHVLAIIRRWQPVTAYFVRKALPRSLASTFSDSPGSIYPVIERLQRSGLVDAEPGPDTGRKAELLTCTTEGEAAIREWLVRVDGADLLPEDPWRTRVLFADLLEPDARQQWLLGLRAATEGEMQRVLERLHLASDLHEAAAAENARLLTEARLVWLDRLIARAFSQQAGSGQRVPP